MEASKKVKLGRPTKGRDAEKADRDILENQWNIMDKELRFTGIDQKTDSQALIKKRIQSRC